MILFIFKFSLIFCLIFVGYPMNISVFGSNALVPRNSVTHQHDSLGVPYWSINRPARNFLLQLKFVVRDTLLGKNTKVLKDISERHHQEMRFFRRLYPSSTQCFFCEGQYIDMRALYQTFDTLNFCFGSSGENLIRKYLTMWNRVFTILFNADPEYHAYLGQIPSFDNENFEILIIFCIGDLWFFFFLKLQMSKVWYNVFLSRH
jgi:hypothetical protein